MGNEWMITIYQRGRPLTPLRCIAISLKSSCAAPLLSRIGQALDIRCVGRQQRRRHPLTCRAQPVTMPLLYLHDPPVRPQQRQLPRQRRRLPTLLSCLRGRRAQHLTPVAIAKAVAQELPSGQAAQQFTIRARCRIPGPMAATAHVEGRPAQRFQQLAQRRRLHDTRPTVGPAPVGRLTHFGAAAQVGHPLTQLLPRLGCVRVVPLLGTPDAIAAGVVDRRFPTQRAGDRCLLVLQLDRVAAVPELQAHALRPRPQVNLGLVATAAVALLGNLLAQVTQGVAAGQRGDAVANPARVPLG